MLEALYNMAGDLQEEMLKLQFEEDELNTLDRVCPTSMFC